VYAELAGSDLDALGALPVPLADGRTVRGPRGVLLPTPMTAPHPQSRPREVDAGALAGIGVRVADPDAVHPLLLRLGAVEASPRAVLDDPHVRAAVAASYEADDPDVVAAAVLPAVAAGSPDPGGEPWLGSLALRDRDGDVRPADELLIPDAPLARVVSDDAPFGIVADDLVQRWGPDVLERVGVLATFGMVHDEDVSLDVDSCDHDLDEEDAWVDATNLTVGEPDVPPVAVELDAVRDLDLVADDRWPEALRLLASPPLRAAVVEPTTVLMPDGRRELVPSYTAWWLRTHPVLGGRLPTELRLAGADAALVGLYDEVAADDTALYAALGVRTSLDRLLAEPDGPAELLDRMGDPYRRVDAANLARLYYALSEAADRGAVEPPARLRVARGLNTEVVDADHVVVLDAPDLLPLLGDRPCLAVRHDRAHEVASMLGVRLASDVVVGEVESDGDLEPVPDLVFAVLDSAVTRYVAHDPLVVDGLAVPWRVVGGRLHAASLAGVARGVAWLSGRWELRHLLAALLEEPANAPSLLAEARLDVGPER
ncbi:MAG: ATP-binding protein, partial [Streptosporangiales bacterium]|nr:ATP-binding protein [Streptosporangiales bacterium]